MVLELSVLFLKSAFCETTFLATKKFCLCFYFLQLLYMSKGEILKTLNIVFFNKTFVL